VIDAPPGTSCPVIAAVKGSDYCVLVTEPTPFGLNDLKLAVEVVRKLEIPFGVLINRSDLGDTKTTEFCSSQDIPILMQIPFRKEFAAAYSRGEPLVSACPEYRTRFQEMVETIRGVCS
jgi:MinD superfamily P-loop ATPase